MKVKLSKLKNKAEAFRDDDDFLIEKFFLIFNLENLTFIKYKRELLS